MFVLLVSLWALMTDDIPSIPSALPFDAVFESVEEIVLDASHEDALLGDVRKVLPFQDKLLVLDLSANGKVLIFDRSGAFVGPLGRYGSGPGEYASASDIAILNKQIYIIDSGSGSVVCLNENFEIVFHKTFLEWTNNTIRNAQKFLSLLPQQMFLAHVQTTQPTDVFATVLGADGMMQTKIPGRELTQKYTFVEGGGLVYKDHVYLLKPLEPVLYQYDLNLA